MCGAIRARTSRKAGRSSANLAGSVTLGRCHAGPRIGAAGRFPAVDSRGVRDGAHRAYHHRLRIVASGLAAVAILVAAAALYIALRPAPTIEPSLAVEIAPSGENHLGQSGNG